MMSQTEIEKWIKDLIELKKEIMPPIKTYKIDVMIGVLRKVLNHE